MQWQTGVGMVPSVDLGNKQGIQSLHTDHTTAKLSFWLILTDHCLDAVAH